MGDVPATSSDRPRRILVVDDEATTRLLCKRLLQEAGYEVLEAEGSPEAMSLVASGQRVDLVLVDVFLPPPDFQLASSTSQYRRMNGHEMVPQMLALTKTLRVLYMSSHSRENLAAQHLLIGARFLQKPLSKAALLSQVTAALEATPLLFDEASAAAKKDVQWVD